MGLFDEKLRFPRYISAHLMPRALRDIHRAFLLQACRRLKIPEDRWPTFPGGINLMGMIGRISVSLPAFEMPEFSELSESLPAWRKKTEKLFRAYCDSYMKLIDEEIDRQLQAGRIVRIEQPDENAIPLNLRYEWTARKYCYNEPYKDMASANHSPETVRKTVSKILNKAEIEKRKKAS